MAIIKLAKSRYQARVRDGSGRWRTKVFATRSNAELHERELKQAKYEGRLYAKGSQGTLNEYFEAWFSAVGSQATQSWRKRQYTLYCQQVSPRLGNLRFGEVRPAQLGEVLNDMSLAGYSDSTRQHVFLLVSKLYRDAYPLFELNVKSPAISTLKPRLVQKETAHLDVEQLKRLLVHVKDRPLGLAIWISAFLGLRVGELQALRWKDLDLEAGWIHVRRSYSKHDNEEREYPKGRKQHSHRLPKELCQLLKERRAAHAESDLVVLPPGWKRLGYKQYQKTLQAYGKELGLPKIGTHGLRHSTAGIYQQFGADGGDLQQLFNHSSPGVTARYVHNRGTRLDRITSDVNLLGCSTVEHSVEGPKKLSS